MGRIFLMTRSRWSRATLKATFSIYDSLKGYNRHQPLAGKENIFVGYQAIPACVALILSQGYVFEGPWSMQAIHVKPCTAGG